VYEGRSKSTSPSAAKKQGQAAVQWKAGNLCLLVCLSCRPSLLPPVLSLCPALCALPSVPHPALTPCSSHGARAEPRARARGKGTETAVPPKRMASKTHPHLVVVKLDLVDLSTKSGYMGMMKRDDDEVMRSLDQALLFLSLQYNIHTCTVSISYRISYMYSYPVYIYLYT
jgi:hypothetical protein